MKSCAQYIADTKGRLGDNRMSDRELGERLGGYSQQAIAQCKTGRMTDPLAIAIAGALRIDPGEVLWTARTERERDPAVRQHLEAWGRKVGKAMASVPANAARAVGALAVALGLMLSPMDRAEAVGGAGRF